MKKLKILLPFLMLIAAACKKQPAAELTTATNEITNTGTGKFALAALVTTTWPWFVSPRTILPPRFVSPGTILPKSISIKYRKQII